MGNQKQKWTGEEEEALLNGVAKHGPGKWKNILKDPDFAPFLTQRSNIDLKDKWRNLSVSNAGHGSKDKSRGASKVKTVTVTPPSKSNAQNSALADGSMDIIMDDLSNNAGDGKNAPRYNAMIFEALTTIKGINGCDINAIVHFIEQRHEVPQNFRRLLSSRLRRLVSQGKLEKIQNCYRLRKDAVLGTRTPTPKQKDVRSRHAHNSGSTSSETVEEAAIVAAYKVAEAENKSFLAAEAVRQAERVAEMAEGTDTMLQLVKEIYEQCSRGEIVLLV